MIDPEGVIEALIAGHSARTWMDEHANAFASDEKGMCSCRFYVAAPLRGHTYERALPLACQELRDARSELHRARHVASRWLGTEVTW